MNSAGLPDDGTAQETNLGICIIDAKGALSSLFSASKYLSQAADCKQNAYICVLLLSGIKVL